MIISTETGCIFDEADDSVLVVCSGTGRDLGNINELTANSAGIPSGRIRMNVGALKHIRERHAEQIKKEDLYDIAEFVCDIVSSYEMIYEGTEEGSLWLSKDCKEHNSVAVIGLTDENGIYRVKTALVMRKRSFKKKKLLFQQK